MNHKDFNYTNNNANNLEWVTHYENVQHSIRAGRYVRTPQWIESLNRGLNKMRIPVVGTEIASGKTIIFDGINKVRKMGFHPSCVCVCCKGKQNIHKGYIWEYAT